MKSFKLNEQLNAVNINLHDLINYDDFLNELNSSEYVITDGDGVVSREEFEAAQAAKPDVNLEEE